MPKETIKITFNEKDLKELFAEKYGLKLASTIIHITHYEGDQRDAPYTSVVVEGERINS